VLERLLRGRQGGVSAAEALVKTVGGKPAVDTLHRTPRSLRHGKDGLRRGYAS
jgi:hypothetical protein